MRLTLSSGIVSLDLTRLMSQLRRSGVNLSILQAANSAVFRVRYMYKYTVFLDVLEGRHDHRCTLIQHAEMPRSNSVS